MRQRGVLFGYFVRSMVESPFVSDAERPKISTTFPQNSRKNAKNHPYIERQTASLEFGEAGSIQQSRTLIQY